MSALTPEAHLSRLVRAMEPLQAQPLAAKLQEFVAEASDEELFHIDPNALSVRWHAERREVLDILLRAVRQGVISMQWAFHCPTCGGVAKESLRLSAGHEHDYCPVCRVDFHNILDRNVEVFFSVGREVRPLPATFQEAYEQKMMTDIQSFGGFDWRRNTTIHGVEVLNHPVFRSMFGDDTLPLDQSLEIQSATVLFTDVTGSTALYERLGDTRAYKLIRDHFDRVFEAITAYGGAAVKTIGDAVMGVFANEVSAVRAAFAMNDALEESNRSRGDGTELWLKIGLHRGPVIVVTLTTGWTTSAAR